MKQINYIFSFFLFFFIFILNSSTLSQNDNDYKELYLEKLKELDDYQGEIDMLFAEYCYFHQDPICYGENDEATKDTPTISNEENDELKNLENNQGEIYYTVTNANMRKSPTTSAEILKTILKNEAVELIKVSDINSNWFIIKYQNIYGYIYGDLISKEIQTKRTRSVKTEQVDNDDEQSDEEWIEEQIALCENEYDDKNLNTRETYNEYCSCYYNGVLNLITQEDLEYYDKHGELSKKYEEKRDKFELQCFEKVGYQIPLSDDEWIDQKIQSCKATYEPDERITRYQFNNYCACYWNQILDLASEEDKEYFDKHGDFSKKYREKEDKLSLDCFKKVLDE